MFLIVHHTVLDITMDKLINEHKLRHFDYYTAFHGNLHKRIDVMKHVCECIHKRFILYSVQLLAMLRLPLLFGCG